MVRNEWMFADCQPQQSAAQIQPQHAYIPTINKKKKKKRLWALI